MALPLIAGLAEALALTGTLSVRIAAINEAISLTGSVMSAGSSGISKMSSGFDGMGTALLKAGNQYEQSLRIIKAGSGATDEVLDGFIKSYENIGKQVPNDLGMVASVMIDVNTKTELNGPALESLTQKVLNLSTVTDIGAMEISSSFSSAMNNWGVSANYGEAVLDKFIYISQGTGIAVDDLANKMTRFGPTMRELGMNFNQSSFLLGNWKKQGVNAELMLGGLRTALGKMTKDGVTDFSSKFDSIKQEIMAAASLEEATAIAMKSFGSELGSDTYNSETQAFTEMASTIRAGLFKTEGSPLFEGLDDSKGTLDRVYESSKTFADKIAILGNNAAIAFGPIGQRLGSMLGNALPFIDKAVKELAPALMEAMPSIERFAGILGSVLGTVLSGVVIAIKFFLKHIDFIVLAIASFAISPGIGLWVLQAKLIIEAFTSIISYLSASWPLIIPVFIGPILSIIALISFYFDQIGAFVLGAIQTIIVSLTTNFSGIGAIFSNLFTGFSVTNVLLGFTDIGLAILSFKLGISQSFDDLKNYIFNFDYKAALLAPINALREELGLLPVRMESLGADIIEGLKRGIAAKAGSLWDSIKQVTSTASVLKLWIKSL
jgi:hypothetical protein